MDEEDEEDHDESMEDDEDLSEEDMEEDKQGSLAKAAITGRSVTLQMLISEKIIEPGPALLSLKYLVKDYCVHVTVTIYSVTGTLYWYDTVYHHEFDMTFLKKPTSISLAA